VSKGFEIMDGFALMTADSKFQNEFIQVCWLQEHKTKYLARCLSLLFHRFLWVISKKILWLNIEVLHT
jgi:hypothetical protein